MDALHLPVLEFAYPVVAALGLPNWTLAILCYGLGSMLTLTPIVIWRIVNESQFGLTEVLCYVIPALTWAFSILASSHQLAICSASFYFGILGGLVLLPNYLSLLETPRDNQILLASLTFALALIPLLFVLTATTEQLGPAISLDQAIRNPQVMVF